MYVYLYLYLYLYLYVYLYLYFYLYLYYIYIFIYLYLYLSTLTFLFFFGFHSSLTLLVTLRFLLSVFCSAFKKEVFSIISSFSKMCLTNAHTYQANYVTKTKLINEVTVITAHEESKYLTPLLLPSQ